MSISGDAGAIGEGMAVAGRDQRVRGRRVDAPEAAGRQDDGLRGQRLDLAVVHVDRDDASAASVFDDERRDEPLVVGADVQLERLLVQDVQKRLAGDVGDVAGAREAGAAEGPLGDAAVRLAVEDGAHVLELDDVVGGFAAHGLDGVLVAEVVAALDGVVGVLLPGVVVAERGVDAALCGDGMASKRIDLAQKGNVDAGARHFEGSAHSRETRSYYEDVMHCRSGSLDSRRS